MDETDTSGREAPLALLRLQDADLKIDRLRHRRATLAERAQLRNLEAELVRGHKELAEVEVARAGLDERASVLDDEVKTVRERRSAIDTRLASAESGSFRDQEAMANELGALSDRMASLEEEELTLLEEMEPLEQEIAKRKDALAELVIKITETTAALGLAEAVVDGELVEAVAEREALSAMVPEALRSEYERLRVELDGVGAARLERGACSGCHLVIPATELDQMRHAAPGVIFHCDQCGRILIAA